MGKGGYGTPRFAENDQGKTMNAFCSTEIVTVSGNAFDFMAPETSDFSIEDIAHALSQVCRFAGHTQVFYSVAQHCVLVSHLVPTGDAMAGLLHDAAEAFLGDVTRPLKAYLPDYRAIEQRVEAAVFGRFGLKSIPPSVKLADRVALATEVRDLMPRSARAWDCLADVRASALKIVPLPPDCARRAFLARFEAVAASGGGVTPAARDMGVDGERAGWEFCDTSF